MTSTRADLDTGKALVSRALVPYNDKPDEVTIASLVDDLLRYGESLLDDVPRDETTAAARGDWRMLTVEGPTDSPLGNWNHARALARTVRNFHRFLAEQ
ncbi:DUF6415 family natural product biosynthesis protein [Streptomyces sp. NPDC059957]|uniref:DUF6415 family natural product biosynthesis protein n=1 Tax=unclassified Streptomyces TaxID=2593676 RepID=UPI0036661A2D